MTNIINASQSFLSITPATWELRLHGTMTWSFLLVFSVIRTKNCSVHCSYQPKNSISTCSLGGKKFHNIPVISLGVRKISWKKKLPFHIIKCFSFKEVPLQEKFLFVPSHLMSYCLWGFLHSVSCFFFFSIYAENTIFKKETKQTTIQMNFEKSKQNTNRSLHSYQHELSISEMPFTYGSSYVKKTYEVR